MSFYGEVNVMSYFNVNILAYYIHLMKYNMLEENTIKTFRKNKKNLKIYHPLIFINPCIVL